LFYNLINNSLKFSEDGRPPVIRIDAQKDTQEGVRMDVISVSDNGIGFDQTQSVLIFETFTRLHSKDKYDGTGLGLALCKKIVERHNGYIRAEGKRDVGAKFIIGLPALHE
jgi:signal transduction histidine kinase